MDERARKRKLAELEELVGSDVEGVEKEQPKEGLKLAQDKKAKKQKTTNETSAEASAEESKAERKAAKLEKQKLKAGKKAEKRKEKKSVTKQKLQEKSGKKSEGQKADIEIVADIDADDEPEVDEKVADEEQGSVDDAVDDEELPGDEIGHFEADGLEEQNESVSPSPSPPSPTFDNPTEPSANTSTSSVIPPATAPKHIKLPMVLSTQRSERSHLIVYMRLALEAALKPRSALDFWFFALHTFALTSFTLYALSITPLLQILLSLFLLHSLTLSYAFFSLRPLLLALLLRLLLPLQGLLEKRCVVSYFLSVGTLLGIQPEIFLFNVSALCFVETGEAEAVLLGCFQGTCGVLWSAFLWGILQCSKILGELLPICECHTAERKVVFRGVDDRAHHTGRR